jgi:ornithine cyclodeaminase/alanine dehydrogenase
MPILLTRKDVESVLSMKDTIDAVEAGFRQLGLGRVLMPQRTAIRSADWGGLHLGMPALIGGSGPEDPGVLALKVVTVYPQNPVKYGLPTTIGTLLLNDARSGALLAIMDAGFLTAMRTGAASGVATKWLAREDAETVGIFGAGVQARAQLRAMVEVRRIRKARVFDIAEPARARFAADMSAMLGIEVEPSAEPRPVASCDIVIAATSSKTPLFPGEWLLPGTHVNGIGSHSPDAREFDSEAIRRCRLIADLAEARWAEDADLQVPLAEGIITRDHVAADLGEVIAGLKEGRRDHEEITLFKSGGLAVQDAAAAARVYALAREQGVGREIEI